MIQDFDLRLEGKNVRIISGKLIQTFDTCNDGFVAQIECDRNEKQNLYRMITPYQAPKAQVYLDGQLRLTGKVTKTEPSKSATGIIYNLAGWSNTYNFMDSELVPPYEYTGLNLEKLAVEVGKQTATRVVYEGQDTGIFQRVTAQRGQTGFQFLSPLAQQKEHVISSTTDGQLLIQQANIKQPTVGTIDENDPNSLLQKQFRAVYDYRKRYRTYKVVGHRWDGNFESLATDPNIKDPRHKVIEASDQVPGGLKSTAAYQLKQILVEALKQEIPVVGWYAPNKKLWQPGTLLTIVSETLFIPDGWTYFISRVEFELSSAGKMANLVLVPKELYSDDAITEPWFNPGVKDVYLQYQSLKGVQ